MESLLEPPQITSLKPKNDKFSPCGQKKLCSSRKCKRKGQFLDLSNFYGDRRAPGGISDICRECKRDRNYNYNYGMDTDQVDDMVEQQNGICPISLKVLSREQENLVVDHIKGTDTVRGILHDNPNKGLGLFDHDPFQLIRGADYVLDFMSRIPEGFSEFLIKFTNKILLRTKVENSGSKKESSQESPQMDLFKDFV